MTIKLIDLYSDNEFNPEQLRLEGYAGVIFKAGQGEWPDVPRVHPVWWDWARAEGLHRGWYWLVDARHESAGQVEAMKQATDLDWGELGLWADVEKPVISMKESDYKKLPYAGWRNVVDFAYLTRRLNVGRPFGIYTGPGAYDLICTQDGIPAYQEEYLAELPLWTAQYPFVYVLGISRPKMYGKWKKEKLWQYREGPDINLFNGTDEEYRAFVGAYTPPPPTEVPMARYEGTVKASATPYLIIRKTPPSGTKIGQILPSGDVTGDEVAIASDGRLWMHILTPMVGYVAAWLLDYVEIQITPPPSTDDYFIHFRADGTQQKYVPE